jgi:hypothetical protein
LLRKNSGVYSDFPLILEDAPVKRFAYTEASEVTQGIQERLKGLDKPLMLGFDEDAHHPGVAYAEMPYSVSSQAFVHKQQGVIYLHGQGNRFGLSRVQLLSQRVHEWPVRHCTPHDPGGGADCLRPRLISTFHHNLMPDCFWDNDCAIELRKKSNCPMRMRAMSGEALLTTFIDGQGL